MVDVRLRNEPHGTTAAVAGEADADNCHQFGETLLGPETAGPHLRLNLSELTFMDSSAISELLRVHDELRKRRIEMQIVDPSPAVHRVLEITGLLQFFGIPAG